MSTEIQKLAAEAELSLIPAKSKHLYYKEYEKLLLWMEQKQTEHIDESVMLAYILEMSRIYKASSLWCIHSKLQAMLRVKNRIDLASYHKLHAFMKGVGKGQEAKKSLVFTEEDLCKFFSQAPDNIFLFLKVVAICGVFGSCRRSEMCNLVMSDIRKEGSALIICIRPSKTEKGRTFAVVDNSNIKYAEIFNKYLALRPKHISTDRVFLKYSQGLCIKQVVGINTFGKCPSIIARYLNFINAHKYTGHAFRRTSATIMANGGMNVDELKRQVGWKSSSTASGYIEESITNKLGVSKLIAGAVQKGGNIGSDTSVNTDKNFENTQISNAASHLTITNNQNCTFNIHLK